MSLQNRPAANWHTRFLEAIFDRDQHIRLRAHPDAKPELGFMFDDIDRDNQRRIARYLKRYGWPDAHIYGAKAATAVFLVIQHASKDYIEAYIPYLRDAVCIGRARRVTLAFMQDRLLLYRGKKQIYGTQYRCVDENGEPRLVPQPIVNSARVNVRRKHAGFDETLEEYLQESTAFLQSVKEK